MQQSQSQGKRDCVLLYYLKKIIIHVHWNKWAKENINIQNDMSKINVQRHGKKTRNQ